MSRALRRAQRVEDWLAERFPGGRINRCASCRATSHVIEDVDITLPDGEIVRLLLKHRGGASLIRAALGTTPAPHDCAARELFVYRDVLPQLELDTPELHGWSPPAADRDGWLALERLDWTELWQVGDMATWEHVARWLAALHALWRPGAAAGPLVSRDAAFYRHWPARALRIHATADRGRRMRLTWLARRWPTLVERLLALPRTLLHGDFYPSNILVGEGRVCAVDWELAAIGPGVLDLAALVSGGWSAAERARMISAYSHAMAPSAWPGDEADLRDAVDDARLLICMQWLGWAPGWQPPPEHAHDWLSEAVAIAEARGW
jgi:hypothetical protein